MMVQFPGQYFYKCHISILHMMATMLYITTQIVVHGMVNMNLMPRLDYCSYNNLWPGVIKNRTKQLVDNITE